MAQDILSFYNFQSAGITRSPHLSHLWWKEKTEMSEVFDARGLLSTKTCQMGENVSSPYLNLFF